MLAIGSCVSSPSSARASACLCDSLRNSGKLAIIRPDNEMSLLSTSISESPINDLIIGRKE